MPEKSVIARARRDAREGKAPTTQAGEFVREEMHHIREGKHGARTVKQAIAIGLSKARRAGVNLSPPPGEKDKEKPLPQTDGKPAKRSAAALNALRKEPKNTASKAALSRHAHESAAKRPAGERSHAARKAAQTRQETSTKNTSRQAHT